MNVQILQLDDVSKGTFFYLPDHLQEQISEEEVLQILEYRNQFFEKTNFTGYDDSDLKKTIAFIKATAAFEGYIIKRAKILAVLQAEDEYLADFGFGEF
ncbi:hypothetical protein [Flexithrix dorotheae]|uniref:hypothetical protein n=1 Tax=Flexithrix dorotheae TaxID=70993 RepID=UPI00035F4E8E|nr:hypothetical protein [Flexithrix dorotheae]